MKVLKTLKKLFKKNIKEVVKLQNPTKMKILNGNININIMNIKLNISTACIF